MLVKQQLFLAWRFVLWVLISKPLVLNRTQRHCIYPLFMVKYGRIRPAMRL